jgi:hypothetical protein
MLVLYTLSMWYIASCHALERTSRNNGKVLTEAQRFETGRIFESGEESKVAAAFTKLLESPDAASSFLKVFEESDTDVGKVYALLGLYQVDRDLFNKLLPRLNQNEFVPVLWFGVSSNQTIGQLVSKIRSGELMTAVRWE